MAYQKVFIPFVGGIDQSYGEMVQAAERLSDVINGRWTKKGEIVKRPGFDSITTTTDAGAVEMGNNVKGHIRGLFSTGRELCAIGSYQLYAYNPTTGDWNTRGLVSPFTAKLDPTFYSSDSHESADMAIDEDGNYVVYASTYRHKTVNASGNDVETWGWRWTVKDADGNVVNRGIDEDETTTASLRPRAIRCAGLTDTLLVARQGGGASGSPTNIGIEAFDTTSAQTASMTPLVSMSKSNVSYPFFTGADAWNNIHTFDLVGLSGGSEALLVWIDDTSSDIDLEVFNAAGTSQRTQTTTEDVYRIAACDDPNNDRVHVAVWARTSGEIGTGNTLRLYSYVKSTLALSFGPLALDTLASNQLAGSTLGLCADTDHNGDDRIMVVWSVHGTVVHDASVGTTRPISMRHRSCNLSGGDVSTLKYTFNCYPHTRPWSKNGRFYVAASSRNSVHHYFGFQAIFDLMEDGTTAADLPNYEAKIVGMYDLGVAPCIGQPGYTGMWSGPGMKGSNNNVEVDNDGVVRFMSLSQNGVDDDQAVTLQPRLSADEVQLDYAGKVTASPVLDGSAIIGGGACMYYDGTHTFEVGFPTPPFITTHDSVNDGSGTGPTGSAYFATAVFNAYDHAGVLHRSMPAPADGLTGHTSGYGIEYAAMTYPGTHRTDSTRVVFYSSSSVITNFRRVMPAFYVVNNDLQASQTTSYLDIIDDPGAFLYTQGGAELPAISPEGAAFVTTAIDRVWLGRHWRRERVSYSKPYAPGSPDAPAIAAEFPAEFTKLLPNGEEPTGMIELSDRLVIFTSKSIYWLAGDGPDNRGLGSDYPPLTLITSDTGCIEPRSIVRVSSELGVMFQGHRGIYLLSPGDTVSFIGYPIIEQSDDTPTIVAASLNPATSEVYFACSEGQILVWNYAVSAWSRWELRDDDGGDKVSPIRGACMHDGVYYVCGSGAEGASTVYQMQTLAGTHDDNGRFVTMTVETGWIQSAQPGGWQRVRKVVPVTKRVWPHGISVSLYRDFETSAYQTASWAYTDLPSLEDPKAPLVSIHNSKQKGGAYKIRISDAVGSTVGLETCRMSGVTLEVMPKRGLRKLGHGQRA